MKLISWNVNGLRACLGKGFLEFVQAEQPDILALQETKMQPEQVTFDLPGYSMWFNIRCGSTARRRRAIPAPPSS